MATFGLRKDTGLTFEAALARVPEALKEEGFGVLTEIDVQDTLRRKLDVPFRKYRILGACNPPLAHRALSAELSVGMMLPCNVVVYEDDAGKAVVMAIDPMQTLAAQGTPALQEIAQTVQQKLRRVLDGVG